MFGETGVASVWVYFAVMANSSMYADEGALKAVSERLKIRFLVAEADHQGDEWPYTRRSVGVRGPQMVASSRPERSDEQSLAL